MPPSVITQNTTVSFNGTLITALHNMTNITKTNTTLAKSEGTNAHDIVVIVIHIFLFLLAAVGNITLIVVRLKTFMQHGLSAYKQLICHLSVADIIFATAVPLDIYSRINKKDLIQNTIVCKFLKTTQSASLTASISIMTVMALERYQGISNPLSHRWTTKKVFLLFVAIWGYSYINFIPYTIALGVQYGTCYDIGEKYPHPEFGKWYTLYQFLSTWLLPVVLISVFHLGMVWKLVTHRKTIRGSIYCRSATADCRSQDGSSRPKRKMIKILVVIVTLFALLTLPIHVWYLWHEFADRSSSQEKGLNMTEIFASMVYTHSAVNPVIYSIMDQSFREDVKNMLGKTRILSVDNQTTIAPTQNVAREDMSVFSIILVVIYIPFFLVAVIGNITVIVVRLKKSMHHRLSAYKQLICHLSLADLLYVTAIPLAIYQRVNSKDWIQNRIVCKLLLTTQSASTTASASILAVMAFERYQGISNPLAHRWSTKKVLLLVAVIWTYSYVNFIPYAIALGVKSGSCCDDQYPHPDFGKWYTLYQFLSAWLLPVVLIALLQFGMMLKLVTHQKTIKGSTYRSPGPEEGNSRGGNRRKPKRKMIKILVVIVTLFATLTLPTHIWYLWYEFSDRSKSERSGLEVLEIFTSLVYMHGAVNPIIYSIMDRSFREDVKLMLGLKSQKKESFCLHVLNGATQESFEH